MNARTTDTDRTIAAKLRQLRLDRDFSQPHVARHLGIKYQSYQKMERGDHSFRVSTLEKLAGLYGVQLSDLTE